MIFSSSWFGSPRSKSFVNWDAQPLLEDLVRLTGEDLSADVRRVAEVAEVADDPPLAEDRGDDREIVELAGGHPGVVVISTSPGPSVSGG